MFSMAETVATCFDQIVHPRGERPAQPAHIVILIDMPLTLFQELAEEFVVALHL